jgi:quinohemoprotein ethanol dehydrogenase
MSYSPLTGLVYIPVQDSFMTVSRLEDGQFQFRLGRTTIGSGRGNYQELRTAFNKIVNSSDEGYTLAWDPVAQKARFRIDNPYEFQGGNLVTAGNLLVQGTMDSTLAIYSADTGVKLWEHPTSSVPVAGPISYSVNGTQYIAVNAGWNQAIVHGLNNPPKPFSTGPAKLVVFKLGAKGVELPPSPPTSALPAPPRQAQPAEKVAQGEAVYAQFCATCHGQNAIGSTQKDLRFISPQSHTDFQDIVLGGKFKEKGMVPFTGVLTPEQVDAVHSYVIKRGQEDWVQPLGGMPPGPPPQPERR